MNIDKNQILDLLKSQGQPDKAGQAKDELPDQVDTDNDEHKSKLSKYGIDPASLISKFGGNLPGGLGKLL